MINWYPRFLYDSFRPILDNHLKNKWNNQWRMSNIYYNMQGHGNKNVKTIFKENFPEEEEELKAIASTFIEKYYDDRILTITKWVKAWIKYKGDFEIHNKVEYWQKAYETLKLRTGDCEDGAILIYKLAILSGIPEWRIKLCAGDVANPNGGKDVGHAYIIYLSEQYNNWFVLDWCYWYADSMNNYRKVPHNKINNYHNIWWTTNHINSWAQHSTEVII